LYDFNGNGEKLVILTSSNFYNSVDFRLKGYEKYGDTPLWGTESYDGSLSFLSVGEMDQTSGKEIVFGIYRYDDVDSAYYHTIKILNGQTGVEEWSSTEESGYLAGPYLGDLDGDETSEILLNIYDYKNENYYLSVLSLTSSVRVYENELKPQAFSISQNYPNPFNPNTILPIHLNAQSQLSISIVNIQGHIVQTLVNGNFASGKYQFSWNGKSQSGESQSSGVYFFLIDINGNQIKRPMVLMK
ncbi:MAG: T9SS type A sorting domain-containing protein, partial [Candidatus Marinimicrobia bacterium]|nr:T9SS type A sorting domain-containing protein [Candidatus Neomarinimicrobiota bacterium]MBT4067930.1 T9SS type A sorting domain-containing protein [Candidatus Neomarinimicrobiota bacterium]MBT4283442.1 T9SS type A sorting domain-containing protein [Candidatus Neomarinimicrobiota bacterium]MBT4635907.1 T9SS type A sorting domain-containing protein [Candidatus Neomarinimicrobiota bacterium]MBT4733827.1 T9SS type A sorting domain-containing protein [Candidatus Neomarinimicrobiota bacterium]